MQHAPPSFSGTLSEFFKHHVVPNTPCPDRVSAFDKRLRLYLASTDPVHVIRKVGSQNRGTICKGDAGWRMLPTDNAPVWWIHAFLLSDAPFPDDNAALFERLPYHIFKLPKGMTYLNAAGFHAAHIVNAKNRDTGWSTWSRAELWRRTVVNIHPCNMFLVAKVHWRTWGGKSEVLDYAKHFYRDRFGAVMEAFLKDVGEGGDVPTPMFEVPYQYAAHPKTAQSTTQSKTDGAPKKRNLTGSIALNRPMVRTALVGSDTTLDITADGTRYLVPHDALLDWVRNNTNALQTDSWLKNGLYSWPQQSKKMLAFLQAFETKS